MVDVLIGCWVEGRKGNAVMNRLPVVGLGWVGRERENSVRTACSQKASWKKEQIIIFLFKRRPCRERILLCSMNISLYAITHPCYLFRVKKDSFLFLCRFLSLSFLQQLLAVSPISGTQKRAFFFFSFLRWDNSSFSQLWAEERRLRSRRKGEKKRAPLFTNDRKKKSPMSRGILDMFL